MTASSQRAALDAVHSARPIVARLSTARHKEDIAADIIDAWTAVETGLRSLVGGTTLGGQALIRELRQRQFLSLEQANALAEFNAARERVARVDYVPNDADITATRVAFDKLETGFVNETAAPVAAPLPPVSVPPAVPIGEEHIVTRPARFNPMLVAGGVLGLMLIVVAAWYFMSNRSGHSAAYNDGVTAFREGRLEAAEGAFKKATTDDSTDAMAHVYLARIEREKGNITNANNEAVAGVRFAPTEVAALRELASVRFALHDWQGAKTFYIRALNIDGKDRTSLGYLGCTMVRLNRPSEATVFFDHAGSGPWSVCIPPAGATGAAPSATAPTNPAVPMTVPRP